MRKEISISVSPEIAVSAELLKKTLAGTFNLIEDQITSVKIVKRSLDARSRQIKININAEIFINEPEENENFHIDYPSVKDKIPVIIVGCGPAGMFAALKLIELGFKPVILERGKDVQSRRKDIADINKEHIVNPDSNYCFGEGGAGTYSDGKLYTRSTKKGDVKKILKVLVAHGATENILIDSHPHIGTNKLPLVVTAIRQSILNAGGEIHFNSRVVDFIVKGDEIKSVIVNGTDINAGQGNDKGIIYEGKAVILATGHSARDIFELLEKKKILIESKPFAMGVRVEHPQELIDSIQYHLPASEKRSIYLPAASYSFAHQVKERGVYSFCMCPGGFIVPAATAPGEVVVNGMSPSRRDSKFANSGIVVSIEPEDLKKYAGEGALSGLRFQQELERMAFEAGGRSQTAPAQRLMDFCDKKLSSTLPDCSYQPGILSASLHDLLPASASDRLREGFRFFGKKMKGYLTNEAVILGVESRTSSPVRIPRDRNTLQHVQIKNLFPCGEGAGYAGGIVSAAVDGELCAEAAANMRG